MTFKDVEGHSRSSATAQFNMEHTLSLVVSLVSVCSNHVYTVSICTHRTASTTSLRYIRPLFTIRSTPPSASAVCNTLHGTTGPL